MFLEKKDDLFININFYKDQLDSLINTNFQKTQTSNHGFVNFYGLSIIQENG